MLIRNTSGDYAFFRNRLCARRILCFLKYHYLDGAAHQLERETTVFFDLSHLQYLATTARWDELTSYVAWFMPSDDPDPPSLQASAFLRCLHVYRVLSWIAAGGKHAQDVDTLFPLLDAAAAKANPQTAALHAFFHDVRRRPPRDLASWMQIWETAAERLKNLALKCPELKGKLHLPHYAPKRWQINLCGVRPILRPHRGKLNKREARDIANFFEEKRQEIQESISGFSSNGISDSMMPDIHIEPAVLQGFSSNGTSDSMPSGMQIEPAVLHGRFSRGAPGADTTIAAGILGGDGRLGSEDESKSKKRKMSAIAETEADASTRLKARKSCSSPL